MPPIGRMCRTLAAVGRSLLRLLGANIRERDACKGRVEQRRGWAPVDLRDANGEGGNWKGRVGLRLIALAGQLAERRSLVIGDCVLKRRLLSMAVVEVAVGEETAADRVRRQRPGRTPLRQAGGGGGGAGPGRWATLD